MLRLFAVLFFLTTFCLSEVIDSIEHLQEKEFDYIVVGGGTAGNVIANRLTENPKVSVLLLEAGGSNDGVLITEVPFFCVQVTPHTPYDWNYTTTPQTGLNGRSLSYPTGHILGGGSSVNFMTITRGTSEDFDRYAQITKDKGWSWDDLQPYFRKYERFTQPPDHHNIVGQFNPAVHGFDGLVSVSLPGFPRSIDSRVIQTTKELSDEFPFNLDMNSGKHLGIGWHQVNMDDGVRSSSATSYLASKYSRRPNLHVLLRAQVTRLLQTSSCSPLPAFREVEFVQGTGGPRHTVTARKEVILSAGAIGTPRILMLSGIGDPKSLSSVGIKSLVNLPSVGKNLTDHPLVGNSWFANTTDTFDNIARNATFAAESLQRWNDDHTGPLVSNLANHLGWFRLPRKATIFNQFADPAAGPNTAHYEMIYSNGLVPGPPPATGDFMSIATAVVSPLSRGSVTLKSNNPFDLPIVNPNFYDSSFDIFTMREAIRSARRFVAAPAWKGYIISPLNNGTTDAELDIYIRNATSSIGHPVGTAAMSPKGATWGVVDPDLRIKGVEGVRIVDASVLPKIPAAHTQVAVYVFAERAADLIKAA